MKTITLNGKEIQISAAEERALRIIASNDFAAPKGDFVEGSSRKYQRFILPSGNRAKQLGISVVYDDFPQTKRTAAYFAKHPRRSVCVTGDVRRINTILAKLT